MNVANWPTAVAMAQDLADRERYVYAVLADAARFEVEPWWFVHLFGQQDRVARICYAAQLDLLAGERSPS